MCFAFFVLEENKLTSVFMNEPQIMNELQMQRQRAKDSEVITKWCDKEYIQEECKEGENAKLRIVSLIWSGSRVRIVTRPPPLS